MAQNFVLGNPVDEYAHYVTAMTNVFLTFTYDLYCQKLVSVFPSTNDFVVAQLFVMLMTNHATVPECIDSQQLSANAVAAATSPL